MSADEPGGPQLAPSQGGYTTEFVDPVERLPDAPLENVPGPGPGLQLREERIRRGRSLRQAHQATRIPIPHLEAIEAEAWERLPAPAFARGFISSYSDYLGMDAARILEQVPIQPTAPGAGLEPQPEAEQPDRPPSAGAPPGPAPMRDDLSGRFPFGAWIAALVVLALVAGVAALFALRSTAPEPETEPEVTGLAEPRVPPPGEAAAAIQPDPFEDLTGVPRLAAQAYARGTGAPFVIMQVPDAAPRDTVIDQYPPAGTLLENGDAILVVVSAGPPQSAEQPGGGAGAVGQDAGDDAGDGQ